MFLAIQIPCFNEEQDLRRTLEGIPSRIPGIDRIEIVVVNDGSTDTTVQVARAAGIRHLVACPKNRGLAKAFSAGIRYCLQIGADLVVNMDADNQYPGSEIAKLIAPILAGKAEIVIGDRQVKALKHFSFSKKVLHGWGTRLVKKLSRTEVDDPVSGFRAYSREAASRMNVLSDYSYTIETLIQAGRSKMAIACVPIEVNPTNRASRLFKSIPEFVSRMAITMIRTYALYQPLKVFSGIGLLFALAGGILFARFLYFALVANQSGGHVQSLILGAVLVIVGFQTFLIGLLGDVVAANRKLLEEMLSQLKAGRSAGDGNTKDIHGKTDG